MSKDKRYTNELKVKAAKQVTGRGYSVNEVAKSKFSFQHLHCQKSISNWSLYASSPCKVLLNVHVISHDKWLFAANFSPDAK
jgi:hypothetical protein